MKQPQTIKSREDTKKYLRNIGFNEQDQIYISNRIGSEYKSIPEFRKDLLSIISKSFDLDFEESNQIPDIFFQKDNKELYDMYIKSIHEIFYEKDFENYNYANDLIHHDYKMRILQVLKKGFTNNSEYEDVKEYILKNIIYRDEFNNNYYKDEEGGYIPLYDKSSLYIDRGNGAIPIIEYATNLD